MTTNYSAPYGAGGRPFDGQPFPGAPPFGTPSPVGSFPQLSFPVSNGPSRNPSQIADFATGVYRPNRYTDQITNGQIVYHYICVPDGKDSNARLADIGVGCLTLVRTRDASNADDPFMQQSKKRRTTGLARPEICVDAYELTQLNNFLWQDARMADTNQKSEFHGQKRHGGGYEIDPSLAEDVKRQFAILGVVLNEPASVDSRDRGIRNTNRTINFVTGGRCMTFSMWNTSRLGSSLWLVLKKVKVNRGGRPVIAWQFVPEFTEHGRRPTLKQLKSEDDKSAIGSAMFVGTLGHTAGDIAMDPSILLTDQVLYHSGAHRPVVEVFLNI